MAQFHIAILPCVELQAKDVDGLLGKLCLEFAEDIRKFVGSDAFLTRIVG